ncbi:MAG: energy-coupling factor ABC transporter permease [Azospira sp.]|jgi:uncharacterized membrane protein|nr:energy-coupling factor ABC transporter permease [Azospira sp.]
MNLPDGLLPGVWTTAAWLLFLPVFLHAVWRAPWRRLAEAGRLNAWLGTVVVLMLLWSLKAGVKPGLSLHLLGAAMLVLGFGPRLAFVGLCTALFGVTLNGDAGWQSYAANALLMGGVGVLASSGVLRFSERFLPPHFFVYVFANGFFGAALAIIAVGIVASAVLVGAGVHGAAYVLGEYLPYVGLLAFAEAWLSGMAVTLFVIYRPQWVATFDDARYLIGR